MKASIKNTLNDLIQENIHKFPVYIPINKFDLSVDYSLVSKPEIIDNYLIRPFRNNLTPLIYFIFFIK